MLNSFSQSIVQYCSLKSTIRMYCSILTRAVLRTVSVAQLLHLNVMMAQIQQDRDAFRKKHELLGREAYRDTHISHTVQAKRVCPNTSVDILACNTLSEVQKLSLGRYLFKGCTFVTIRFKYTILSKVLAPPSNEMFDYFSNFHEYKS